MSCVEAAQEADEECQEKLEEVYGEKKKLVPN